MLFENYGNVLFGYSVKNWGLDEDAGYEVLYKTLERAATNINTIIFDSERHFNNWLFKIHKNNLLQYLRSLKAKEQGHKVTLYANWEVEFAQNGHEAAAANGYNDDGEYSGNEGEIVGETSELMLAMESALKELKPKERDILLLRMSNYSYDEIARMLGVDNNQLKVAFNRAKAKIHKRTLEILNVKQHANT